MKELKALSNVLKELSVYNPLLCIKVEESRKSVVVVLRNVDEEIMEEVIEHSRKDGSLHHEGRAYLYSIELGGKK